MYRTPPVFPNAWACEWGEDGYGLWQVLMINDARQVFRWIEPGTFLMGSPQDELERESWAPGSETLRSVKLTQGFWLADTAVTQALWLAVLGGDNPSSFHDRLENPVERISWDDARAFIDRLNTLIPGLSAKLPTEIQWEYACRAGTETPFSFGKNINPGQVNYNGQYPYASAGKGHYREKTVPVKSLPANPWGLYEMHGNVWEWCQDAWQINPGGDEGIDLLALVNDVIVGVDRIARGGSWGSAGTFTRSAVRTHYKQDNRGLNLGFRLALGSIELGT